CSIHPPWTRPMPGRRPTSPQSPASRVSPRRVLWPLAVAASLGAGPVAVASDDRSRPVDFAAQVRPIFAHACLKCHGPEKQRGGLRLDSRGSVLAGGDSGEPAVVPGDVGSGTLVERVASDDES